MVGPSGEAVGRAEQAAKRASGWAVVHGKRKEGEGSRLGQLWLWAEREGREKKKKKSLFYFSTLQTCLKFKQGLNSSHPTLFLHSNKTQCTRMNATKVFLNLMFDFNIHENYYLA